MCEMKSPQARHWAADPQMRKTLAGEHWCIWLVEADGSPAHTEPIAAVWNYLHDGETNKRLIAAAPEMARALRAAVEWAETGHFEDGSAPDQSWLPGALAALARLAPPPTDEGD